MTKRVLPYLRFAAVLVAALAALPAISAHAMPPDNDAFGAPMVIPQSPHPYANIPDVGEPPLEPFEPINCDRTCHACWSSFTSEQASALRTAPVGSTDDSPPSAY